MVGDNLMLIFKSFRGDCAGFQTCQIPPCGTGVASLFQKRLCRDHKVIALTSRQGGTYLSFLISNRLLPPR